MGLAIVKKLVEAGGGRILVADRDADAAGVAFRFTWPKPTIKA